MLNHAGGRLVLDLDGWCVDRKCSNAFERGLERLALATHCRSLGRCPDKPIDHHMCREC
jgi:hypothetical protein